MYIYIYIYMYIHIFLYVSLFLYVRPLEGSGPRHERARLPGLRREVPLRRGEEEGAEQGRGEVPFV